jgi:hypothetical protein
MVESFCLVFSDPGRQLTKVKQAKIDLLSNIVEMTMKDLGIDYMEFSTPKGLSMVNEEGKTSAENLEKKK